MRDISDSDQEKNEQNDELVLRDLTLDDMETNHYVLRALAGEPYGVHASLNGELVGMCGIVPIYVNRQGEEKIIQNWVFLDITSEEFRRRYSHYIAINMLRSVRALKKAGEIKVIYTFLDTRIPRAQELLDKIGFTPIPPSEKTPHIHYTEERWGRCHKLIL